ncbi:adhesion G-protein coupled receptor D1-like [Argiope bruennichi]|uniref:adhesion G-protein coupled receptor D1-like n=1 Tax=Argiope bruennichi TaxID=94029 RepID=UPI00249598B8|nr:adhesion G-protein coupled receptor D1-like [Argiope bruennichi]
MSTGDAFDISSEVSNREELVGDEVPLLVFRVIGCTVVTLLVGFTIIIYVTSGMFHIDCLAQICSETCVFCAYMLILLTTTESFRINEGMCLAIAVFLHFFFVGASFFQLLEVICICQARVSWFRRLIPQISTRNLFIAGWVFPGIVTGISAIIWFNQYTTKRNCWLNTNRAPYWPSIIPIVGCTALQLFLIFITLCTSDVPVSLSESQYKRAKSYRTTRWASAIITFLLILSWFFGVTAYHTRKENFYGAFTVSSILLGVCIFILRISTDDEMREKITANLLCCLVPNNKVTSATHKTVMPQKDYTQTILDTMTNGKLVERQNRTLHK